uniref:Uncharacterized protein n=1 Tax=Anopheles melas TaxID=34690 RepID=A0A182TL69_9DIPT
MFAVSRGAPVVTLGAFPPLLSTLPTVLPLMLCFTSSPFTIFSMLFSSEGEFEAGGGGAGGPSDVGATPGAIMEAVEGGGGGGACPPGGGGGGCSEDGDTMLLFAPGGMLAAAFASAVVGEVGCWVGVGDTEMGRVGGELEAARGWGLLLRLRAPAEFEPGVTASNADPSPDGRL